MPLPKNLMDSFARVAEIYDIPDGDTVAAATDLGFGQIFKMRFRLFGINAPERKGATFDAGERSRLYLQQALIKGGDPPTLLKDGICRCGIRAFKTPKGNAATEKYGRYLVELRVGASGRAVAINEALLLAGMATPALYLSDEEVAKLSYTGWPQKYLDYYRAHLAQTAGTSG